MLSTIRDTFLIAAATVVIALAAFSGALVLADPLNELAAVAYVGIVSAFVCCALIAGCVGYRIGVREQEPVGDNVLELDLATSTDARVIALAAASALADDQPHTARWLRNAVDQAHPTLRSA